MPRLQRISDLFRRLNDTPELTKARAAKMPTKMKAAELTLAAFGKIPECVNITAAWLLWSAAAPPRRVWRFTPETAARVAGVSLAFVPEIAPWGSSALVVETAGEDETLYDDVFSLAAYTLPVDSGNGDIHFVVTLTVFGGAYVYPTPAGLHRVNARMAETGAVLADDYLHTDDGVTVTASSPGRRAEHLAALRYALAAGYFVTGRFDEPEIRETSGPVERGPRGRVIKRGGKAQPIWTYADLRFAPRPPAMDADGDRQSGRDLSGLALRPVVVREYFRREGDRVIFVGAHGSHRWSKPEILGQKTKI